MHRLVAVAAAVIMTFSAIPTDNNDIARQQFEASGADKLTEALPEETRDLLSDIGVELTEADTGEVSVSQIAQSVAELGRDSMQAPIQACAASLCIIILAALAKCLTEKESGSLPAAFDTIASAAAATAICVPVASFIDRAADVLSSLCSFSAVLVPVLTGLAAASGHSASAAAYSAFTLGVIELLDIAIPTVVIPLLRVMLGVAAVSSLSTSAGLDRLASTVDKNIKWLLTIGGILLSGTLGISSVAASAADSVSAKAARFILSGAVPVVGGAIRDAMGTINNCIAILRTSAGAFGLIAGLFVVLPAIINGAAWLAGLAFSAWAAETLGAQRPAAAMRSLGSVVSLTLGLMALAVVITTCSSAIILNLRSV